jgi:hypothetical protein
MRRKQKKFNSIGSPVLVLVIVLAATAGYAQTTRWPVPADPLMVVIPVRSSQEIATDLENAQAAKRLALDRHTQAVGRLQQIASAIENREASIKDMDRRENDAKDNQRSSEEKSLQIQAKANKQAIDLLKRLRDLREAEVEVAKAEEDHADITISVFQMESELQSKRYEYNWYSSSGGNLTKNTEGQVIGELEMSLLKLQKDLASATQEVASKLKDVINRRMKLHEAQLKLGV